MYFKTQLANNVKNTQLPNNENNGEQEQQYYQMNTSST